MAICPSRRPRPQRRVQSFVVRSELRRSSENHATPLWSTQSPLAGGERGPACIGRCSWWNRLRVDTCRQRVFRHPRRAPATPHPCDHTSPSRDGCSCFMPRGISTVSTQTRFFDINVALSRRPALATKRRRNKPWCQTQSWRGNATTRRWICTFCTYGKWKCPKHSGRNSNSATSRRCACNAGRQPILRLVQFSVLRAPRSWWA